LIVTALQKDKQDDSGNITGIIPDLPGALAEAVTALFNSVISIGIKNTVVAQPDKTTKRISNRILYSRADGLRRTDDRTGIFSAFHERAITDAEGKPLGINTIYEAWLAGRPQVVANV